MGHGVCISARLAGVFQQPHQFAMHVLIAGDDVAGDVRCLATFEIGAIATSLAYQDETSSNVPWLEVALPKYVEAPGRDPGEIERGGSETSQADHHLLHGSKLAARQREIAAAAMRQAAGDNRVGEALARRNAQPLIVEESAL